jgi:kinesin family protein 6/9
MSQNRVRVCVRLRPTANFAQEQIGVNQDDNTVRVSLGAHGGGEGGGHESSSNRQDTYNFKFHSVLHNAGQDAVYETCCRSVVQGATNGTNGTIFAYGQTGAGKTFTMLGNLSQYHQRGCIPRAVSHLFEEIDTRTEYEYKVRCSYLELYNERIFDLLGEKTGETKDWKIGEDRHRGMGMHVKDLTVASCNTEEDVLNCLFRGAEMRTTAKHVLNTSSNRSHCIFTVYLEQRSRLGSSEKVVHSKLNLVDLAGSERLKKVDIDDKTKAGRTIDDTTKRESMYINKSLTYLEQCVVALTTRGRSHVPYRQSKLTHLLKDGIGGNSNSMLLACVYGEEAHLEETLSTLRLAQRMMRVQNKTEEISTIDPRLKIKQLERQVKSLKQELMMHDALAERSSVAYDEYTPEQRYDVEKSVRAFLDTEDGTVDDPIGKAFGSLQSLRHITEVFRAFKLIVRDVESKTEERLRQRFTLGEKIGSPSGKTGEDGAAGGVAEDSAEDGEGGGTGPGGEMEGGAGYAVGVAAAGARPASIDMGELSPQRGGGSMMMDASMAGSRGMGSPASRVGGASPGSPSQRKGGRDRSTRGATTVPETRPEAFVLFKQSDGYELNEALRKEKRAMKALQRGSRTVREALNQHKLHIDALQSEIEAKRKAQGSLEMNKTEDGEEIIDEEEFRMLSELQQTKRAYRSLFSEHKDIAIKLSAADRSVRSARTTLVDQFDRWFAVATGEALLDGAKDVTNDDRLDEGEMFEKMEMERVMDEDPESVAFFMAQKQRSKSRRKDHGSTMRAIRDKRLNK